MSVTETDRSLAFCTIPVTPFTGRSVEPRKLKILIVTPRFYPEMGGIETHVYEVSKRLIQIGHQVTVLTTDRSGSLPAVDIIDGIHVQRVKVWPNIGDYYLAPALLRQASTADCDIIHVQSYHTFVAPLAMVAAIRRRIPFVITFHSGGHSSPLRRALRHIQWTALAPLVRRADAWVGVSRFEAEFMSRKMHLAPGRGSMIRNGAEMTSAPAPVIRRRDPFIVSVGRLERYKGHHRVIEAFPSFLQRFPNARLRILGEGPYKPKLLALVQKLGLGNVVEVAGIPPRQRGDIAALLASASLAMLLSDYEAHPVAVMEALASQCPVLVTRCTGLAELVDEGLVAGVPPNASAETIARAMALQLGRPQAASAPRLPTWPACVEQLCELYYTVLAGSTVTAAA